METSKTATLEPPELETREVPEVRIDGDEAVIRVRKATTESPEERTVKLPYATWA